jgi:NAD(P)-dependent dehydrogenase (short-subunit alcohol dehydrogenase family)
VDIRNKVALITGASQGIGAAAARAFVAAGARVAVAARSGALLENLVSELGDDSALAVPADVTLPGRVIRLVERTIERFGHMDIVVNSAGVGLSGAVADLDILDLNEVLKVNLFGPISVLQATIPHLRKNGGGVIVNISSMVTKTAFPEIGGYRASKMALDAISDSARIELRRDNIRVVTVYPDATDTLFYEHAIGGPAEKEEEKKEAAARRSAQFVAEKIVQAVRSEPRVQFMDFKDRISAGMEGIAPGVKEWIMRLKTGTRSKSGTSPALIKTD